MQQYHRREAQAITVPRFLLLTIRSICFFMLNLIFHLTDNMKNYVRQNAVIHFKTYSEFSLLDFRTEVRVVNRTEVGEMLGRER